METPTTIEGELTIYEQSLKLFKDIFVDCNDPSYKELKQYLQRVIRATTPPPETTEGARVEPLGKTVWDWIQGKNIRLMHAAAHEGAANAIMDMLRGMEVWGHDRGVDLEYVDVGRTSWTPDGRLVIEFKVGTDA